MCGWVNIPVLFQVSGLPLWAWGRWWSSGWLPLRRSGNRKRWGPWQLLAPAACSQRWDRSTGAAGRRQTRSPEPENGAKMEHCKCQQMQTILNTRPWPNANPLRHPHPITEQQLSLIRLKDEIPQRKPNMLLIVPAAESANDFYNEQKKKAQ